MQILQGTVVQDGVLQVCVPIPFIFTLDLGVSIVFIVFQRHQVLSGIMSASSIDEFVTIGTRVYPLQSFFLHQFSVLLPSFFLFLVPSDVDIKEAKKSKFCQGKEDQDRTDNDEDI